MQEKADIINKCYDLLRFIMPVISKFPRNHKFLLGDRLATLLLDVQQLLIEAYYTKRNNKKEKLIQVNIELEKARHIIRLSYDLKAMLHKQYKETSQRLDEVGRMNGAWIKSL